MIRSAIMAGRFLREAGIDDFVLVEKAGDFGGTVGLLLGSCRLFAPFPNLVVLV
jgi:hypothetical protein